MIDLCQLNPLMCQNNGRCTVNISSNTTYCQCDECHYGILCDSYIWRGKQFDTYYPRFIVSLIAVCFSILNNALVFELFIRCLRIRATNCGVYLFVYAVLSFVGYIFLVIGLSLKYYRPKQLFDNYSQYEALLCFFSGLDSNVLFYLCIWLSSLIALERGLIVRFENRLNATRWRSFIATIVIFAIAIACVTPMVVYKCDWDNVPGLRTFYRFSQGFFLVVGITIYIIATIIILFSFTDRIRSHGTENGLYMRTFLKLLKSHLFVFVPPIAYGICQIPYNIVLSRKKHGHSYYQCGIPFGEFIMKIIIAQLTIMPYGLTWLLFVYPSRVYMTEFYSKTRSGQCLATIIISCRTYVDSAYNILLRITNLRRYVWFENN